MKGREKRPAFDRMLKDATRGRFDLVMAWSVDRLGRSLQDLVGFLGDVHAQGIDLYLDRQGVDTTTPPVTPFDVFLDARGAQFSTPGTGLTQAPPSGGVEGGLATLFNNPSYAATFGTFQAPFAEASLDRLGVWDEVRARSFPFDLLGIRAPGPEAPLIAFHLAECHRQAGRPDAGRSGRRRLRCRR